MLKRIKRAGFCVLLGFFFFLVGVFAAPEDTETETGGGETEISRGSIPEALLRPQRGEAPRYPVDTVIGALGRGEASEEAYRFAREVLSALVAGNQEAASLAAQNSVVLEGFLSALGVINPRSYRLGSGREESDGAVSFLVRFIGREQGISGELYIRSPEPADGSGGNSGIKWEFDDLILEEARDRNAEADNHSFEFSSYERFF
jgi:hypothetical protein